MAAIIVILLFWIYQSGGIISETKELRKRVEELEEENKELEETNEALRASIESSSESSDRIIQRITKMTEKLFRVKEALRGSDKAKQNLEEEFDSKIGPDLIRDIFATDELINFELKRRLADKVFVGDIGKDILRGVDEGIGLNDATVEAGVPLRIGREKAKILKKTGYLDKKLNLTRIGREVLERDY